MMAEEQGLVLRANELQALVRGASTSWHELLKVPALRVGVYRLEPGQPDRQQPHTEDEIYYVIEGTGVVEIAGQRSAVQPGDAVYVARTVAHRFLDYPAGLTLFVVFAAAP